MNKSRLNTAVLAGLHPALVGLYFNDGKATSIEDLQNRLTELHQNAVNIQARADAENRDLDADESKEVEQISAAFEAVEAEIERRERINQMQSRIAPPGQARKTDSDDAPRNGASEDAPKPKSRTFTQPRDNDPGKWGFRSAGEFLNAVLKASGKGAAVDPRLIANAVPSSVGSEGVGADGGFAVPPDFRSQIMIKVMGEDSLLSRTDQQTSSSNAFTFPKDETTPWQQSGGLQAYWESEGGLKTQSKPLLQETTVKLNKLIALVPLTDELLEDAPSMSNYVNRKVPDKINFKVNDALIRGTGAGQPLGVLNSAATVSVAEESAQVAATVVFQNIVKMWSRLAPWCRANAVWNINPDVEPMLQSLAFPNAGSGTVVPVYLPPGGLSGSPYATLYGRPVVPMQSCSALGTVGDIILADWSQYLTIVKTGGIRSDVSIHLWFDYDLTAFRFVLRVGGQPWYTSSIVQANSALPRGAFVTLATRS
jgi:HK97 family phage major capsid protein